MTRSPVAELQQSASLRREARAAGERRRPARRSGASALARAAILGLVASAAGCGFHLQGAGTLPPELAKTYLMSVAPRSDFIASLTETLRLRGAQVLQSPDVGAAVLSVVADDSGQRVLSVTARNIPREAVASSPSVTRRQNRRTRPRRGGVEDDFEVSAVMVGTARDSRVCDAEPWSLRPAACPRQPNEVRCSALAGPRTLHSPRRARRW